MGEFSAGGWEYWPDRRQEQYRNQKADVYFPTLPDSRKCDLLYELTC